MGGPRVRRKSAKTGRIGVFGLKGKPPKGVERRKMERRGSERSADVFVDIGNKVVVPAKIAKNLRNPRPEDLSYETRKGGLDGMSNLRKGVFSDRRTLSNRRAVDERTGQKDRRASKRPGASGRRKSDKK